MKTHTIVFETVTQAAIFEVELKGQISDGHWENYRQSNYQFWCGLSVQWQHNPGEPCGIFPLPGRVLRFDDPALYNIVGDRMTRVGRLALMGQALDVEPLRFAQTMEDVLIERNGKPWFHGVPKWWLGSANSDLKTSGFYQDRIDYVQAFHPLRLLKLAGEVWQTYTKKHMIADLKAIKRIAKTPLPSADRLQA